MRESEISIATNTAIYRVRILVALVARYQCFAAASFFCESGHMVML